jgi:hypothetical protein
MMKTPRKKAMTTRTTATDRKKAVRIPNTMARLAALAGTTVRSRTSPTTCSMVSVACDAQSSRTCGLPTMVAAA